MAIGVAWFSREIPHVFKPCTGLRFEPWQSSHTMIVSRVYPPELTKKGSSMKFVKAAALGASLFFFGATAAQAGETFDAVKAKGFVQCGFHTGLPGFSIADSKGQWTGIDVDVCRGIAAMVFGDATKYKATAVTTQQRFTALQSGEIDVLTRNTTATMTRDTTLGLMSTGINYY